MNERIIFQSACGHITLRAETRPNGHQRLQLRDNRPPKQRGSTLVELNGLADAWRLSYVLDAWQRKETLARLQLAAQRKEQAELAAVKGAHQC